MDFHSCFIFQDRSETGKTKILYLFIYLFLYLFLFIFFFLFYFFFFCLLIMTVFKQIEVGMACQSCVNFCRQWKNHNFGNKTVLNIFRTRFQLSCDLFDATNQDYNRLTFFGREIMPF